MGNGRGESCTQWGTLTDTCPKMGMVRRRGSLACMKWEKLSDTCPQWGMGEDRSISAMNSVSAAHSYMSPGGDRGEHSGGHSVTQVPSGGWGGEENLCQCTQWGTLTDAYPQVKMEGREEDLYHLHSGMMFGHTCPL